MATLVQQISCKKKKKGSRIEVNMFPASEALILVVKNLLA